MKGLVLERFRVLRHLTTGGIGDLWLAHDPASDRRVVLKTLRPLYLDDVAMRARFLEECALLERLDHAAIVRFVAAGPWGVRWTLAMEHIDGTTLAELSSAYGPRLPAAWVVHIVTACARALGHLHAKCDSDGAPLVHQDVSPQNVMIDRAGRVKLIDVGLASSGARAIGIRQGKPAYMAPEQARAERVDARTDLFALGVVLLEALVGKRPFDHVADDELFEVMAHLDHIDLPRDMDGELRALLARMLAPRMADRFARLDDAVDALQRWQCGRATTAASVGRAVDEALDAKLFIEDRQAEATTVIDGPA